MIDEHPVSGSSNIAHGTYDEASKMMTVRFHSGGTWAYEGVSPETWQGFKDAGSKGEYLHRQVRGQFGSRKL